MFLEDAQALVCLVRVFNEVDVALCYSLADVQSDLSESLRLLLVVQVLGLIVVVIPLEGLTIFSTELTEPRATSLVVGGLGLDRWRERRLLCIRCIWVDKFPEIVLETGVLADEQPTMPVGRLIQDDGDSSHGRIVVDAHCDLRWMDRRWMLMKPGVGRVLTRQAAQESINREVSGILMSRPGS